MADLKMSIEEIKSLMTHLANCKLEGLSIKDNDFELNITAPQAVNCVTAVSQPAAQAVSNLQAETEKQANVEKIIDGNVVKSPIVGTYYSSPSPEKDAFVTVGSRVKKGDTLFIIESMKLMNEVQSEFDGEVTEILLTDGTAVEYNQPVMIVK